MTLLSAPVEKLNEIVASNNFVGEVIDFDILKFLGVFVIKNAFRSETVDFYKNTFYNELLERRPYHLSMIDVDEKSELNKVLQEPEFIKIASQLFNGNVSCDFVNVFKKDRLNTHPVFLHQDSSYLIGDFDKYSAFISLTACNRNNGGLVVYPGTHHFGHLGDAGEIANNILPVDYPKINIDSEPGDVLIMHSAIWHESPENIDLTDRVYLETKMKDANDSTAKNLVCGKRTSEWFNPLTLDEIFSNSRTQRLKRLYKEFNELSSLKSLEY